MWRHGRAFGLSMAVVVAACGGSDGASTPTTVPSVPSTASSLPSWPTRLTADERSEVFEAVWQTVNDGYFDPTFGGMDWRAIGDRYRERLAAVDDDATFWRMVNEMLFELGVSHLAAVPAELANEFEPTATATGTSGLDVRLLGGQVVVTRVSEGSPAARAGVRPGFVITSIDGRTVESLAAEALPVPPDNDRNVRARAVQGVRSLLYGDAGGQVAVEYLDGDGRSSRVVLTRDPRPVGDCGQVDPSLPPMCAEVEVRRLAGGVGYLRFTGFAPSALDRVLQAIDDLHAAPALIIDLRGNPGGVLPVRKAIASQLVGEPVVFMRYRLRTGVEEVLLDPVADAYPGKVVILVDELTASSAEEFSGSLQSMGRATIVGSQSPGRCLVGTVVVLPHDTVLMYPSGESQTPAGRVLENNGVLPDRAVDLDRLQLLNGIDAQLEAAVQQAQ